MYNISTRLQDDKCAINMINHDNIIISKYQLPSYMGNSDPSRHKFLDSIGTPGIFQTGNYAGYPSHIDIGSKIRNGNSGNIITHTGARQNLKGEYMGPPDKEAKTMALNPDDMSKLLSGDLTKDKMSIRGKEIDRFVPLIPQLEGQIQNPKNLIPKYWVRGGMDTRVVIRNADYLKMCGLKR